VSDPLRKWEKSPAGALEQKQGKATSYVCKANDNHPGGASGCVPTQSPQDIHFLKPKARMRNKKVHPQNFPSAK